MPCIEDRTHAAVFVRKIKVTLAYMKDDAEDLAQAQGIPTKPSTFQVIVLVSMMTSEEHV